VFSAILPVLTLRKCLYLRYVSEEHPVLVVHTLGLIIEETSFFAAFKPLTWER